MSETGYAEPETNIDLPDLPEYGDEDTTETHTVSKDADAATEQVDASEASKSSAPTKGNQRPLIRRAAAKALEVDAASEKTRQVVAALLSSSEEPIELTCAIMTAGREARQPLGDIDEIIDCLANEPWEAGVVATALDRSRQKNLWTLLRSLGAADSANLPAADVKAGSAIVKAIHGLSSDAKDALGSAAELLKRS